MATFRSLLVFLITFSILVLLLSGILTGQREQHVEQKERVFSTSNLGVDLDVAGLRDFSSGFGNNIARKYSDAREALGRRFRDFLSRHQSPADCSSKKFLILPSQKDTETFEDWCFNLIVAFSQALLSDRVAVSAPGAWTRMRSASCHSNSLSCAFEPVTSCPYQNATIIGSCPTSGDVYVTMIPANAAPINEIRTKFAEFKNLTNFDFYREVTRYLLQPNAQMQSLIKLQMDELRLKKTEEIISSDSFVAVEVRKYSALAHENIVHLDLNRWVNTADVTTHIHNYAKVFLVTDFVPAFEKFVSFKTASHTKWSVHYYNSTDLRGDFVMDVYDGSFANALKLFVFAKSGALIGADYSSFFRLATLLHSLHYGKPRVFDIEGGFFFIGESATYPKGSRLPSLKIPADWSAPMPAC